MAAGIAATGALRDCHGGLGGVGIEARFLRYVPAKDAGTSVRMTRFYLGGIFDGLIGMTDT